MYLIQGCFRLFPLNIFYIYIYIYIYMSSIDVSINAYDASFNDPRSIAFDNSGNYYVTNRTFISKI
jgi:hypothetical protein